MARIKDRTRQLQRTGAAKPLKPPGEPAAPLVFKTATYARLSVESAVTESDSIASQQMLMRDYLKGRKEFLLVREYKDDGVSGTGFNRQALDSLLEAVRKGDINCIIVKDFSRFGRDHIEVGCYLEKVFPFLGVRFISINDGYDSFDRECADKKLAVILKNLVNEYVAKDISLKVTSSYKTKQENGEYDGGRAPYGYVFADKRKTRFAVDERAAEIIRDIFAWTIQGKSARAIVRELTKKNINPPRAYQDTGLLFRQEGERCYWNELTVNRVLQNMAYVGHMALHKWKESKAEGLSSHKLEAAMWMVTEDTHPAIITEQDFALVQEILKVRKARYKSHSAINESIIRPENILKGKVLCGDCRRPAARMGSNYHKKENNEKGQICRIYRYRCRTYRDKGAQECTSKSISEKALEEIVYGAVTIFIRQLGSPDEFCSSSQSALLRKTQRNLAKELYMEDKAVRQRENEKILLYQEYTKRGRSDGTEGMEDCNKEWYLKEKQKREKEIYCHQKRKEQLEEKAALFKCAQNRKEYTDKRENFFTTGEGKLTGQMVSVFVKQIFLYDGKRVEIVLNFRDEQEEGEKSGGREGNCFVYENFKGR